MSDKLDVVGIGNAMVDAIIPSSKKEVEKHKINRDSMNLIDELLNLLLNDSLYPHSIAPFDLCSALKYLELKKEVM